MVVLEAPTGKAAFSTSCFQPHLATRPRACRRCSLTFPTSISGMQRGAALPCLLQQLVARTFCAYCRPQAPTSVCRTWMASPRCISPFSAVIRTASARLWMLVCQCLRHHSPWTRHCTSPHSLAGAIFASSSPDSLLYLSGFRLSYDITWVMRTDWSPRSCCWMQER